MKGKKNEVTALSLCFCGSKYIWREGHVQALIFQNGTLLYEVDVSTYYFAPFDVTLR